MKLLAIIALVVWIACGAIGIYCSLACGWYGLAVVCAACQGWGAWNAAGVMIRLTK